jgi:SAM-dependent methyltransferase
MFSSDTAYDKFMGRFSVRLAPLFADFAGVSAGSRVLDVGAGTGALTAELLRRDATVAAMDPSPAFVAALKSRFPDIDAREAGAEDLPWPDASFDAALAQLVIAFMADAEAGVAEMRRVVEPGGVVAVCMWDREGMELLHAVNQVQAVVDPGRSADTLPRFRDADSISELLGDGAEVELLVVDAGYEDFDEFWSALTGGVGPAGAWVASLDDERRAQAREEFRRVLGDPGGAFTLTGGAWAARVARG